MEGLFLFIKITWEWVMGEAFYGVATLAFTLLRIKWNA